MRGSSRVPLILGALLLAPPARALDAHAFTLGSPSGDPEAWTRLGATRVAPRGSWDAGLVLDYAEDPLVERFPWGRTPIVDSLGAATVVGAYSFGGVQVNGQMPVLLFGSDDSGGFTAIGDARVGALVPLLSPRRARPAVALDTAVWIPTGTAAHWAAGGARAMASANASLELGPIGLEAVAGLVVGMPDQVRNVPVAAGPVAGLGAAWRITDATSTALEVSTGSNLGFSTPPIEATLSQRLRLPAGGPEARRAGDAWAVLGGAVGLNEGVGASRWRAFAGVGFSTRAPEPVSALASVVPAAAIPADADADRDGDGFPDVIDRCPDQAETVDGFEDGDGCPELDGDGDGVSFERDACPREPIRPEQDPRYSDGCPKLAELAGDRIIITEAVFFREDRAELLPSSERVLEAVLAVMTVHPEIAYFLVEGHTNTNGREAYNVRLSDARAFTVMRWLADHGVASGRLLSKGFGESRPLVPDADPDAFALNRRVEFRVVRIEDIPADARRIVLPPEVRR